MLANMAVDIECSRLLSYQAAWRKDQGLDFEKQAAMAKVFAADVAMEVTTNAMQVCGGAGYMRDYPLEKMMRDAKISQIYEGSNQVLRNAIALELRKRKARTP